VPTRLWILVFAGAAPLWLAAPLLPGGGAAALALCGLWIGAWALARARLPHASDLDVERRGPHRAVLGDVIEATLRIRVRRPGTWRLEIRDEVPAGLRAGEGPPLISVPGGEWREVVLTTRAEARGRHELQAVHVRIEPAGGLSDRVLRVACPARVDVHPQVRALKTLELSAALAEGDEPQRRRGGEQAGTEFESLRPYVRGDPVRHIDWKATARRGEPIVRHHQIERGQHLAVILDVGRSMGSRIDGRSRLEYAVEASVILGRLCQRRRDTMSLTAFSNRVEAELPPIGGAEILPRALHALLELQPRPIESDYWNVFGRVLGRLTKRSLIVTFTDIGDADSSRGLIENLTRAARRHAVLCVVFEDPSWLRAATDDRLPLARRAGARFALSERRAAQEVIRSRGVDVLPAQPEDLGLSLVARHAALRSGAFA
jgi:uncharacterized protein (DUF58 family)